MPGSSPSPLALLPHELHEVTQILAQHLPAVEVRAFGSRVKGTAKPYSDLDLALMTTHPLSLEQEAVLKEAFGESSLPFKVDLLDWATTTPAFQDIVRRDGVPIQFASAAKA